MLKYFVKKIVSNTYKQKARRSKIMQHKYYKFNGILCYKFSKLYCNQEFVETQEKVTSLWQV